MTSEPEPTGPDTLEPDTKDWTWVLQRPCPECGFDAAAVAARDVAARVRANAASWVAVLAGDVATRPDPRTWSALEYACHVRDVLRLYDQRLQLMLTENDPLYPDWDQDAAARQARYAEQDPARVSADLLAAASAIADRFDAVVAEQWARTGRRDDGAAFTVDSFSRYFLHDVVHHLHDVQP